MKRLLCSFVLLCSLTMVAFCQTDDERARFVDDFGVKVNKLDVYNMILPVLMTPDQVRKILPSIEKARQRVRETRKLEYEEVKKLDTFVDDALKKAAESGSVPPPSLMGQILAERLNIDRRRNVMAALNTGEVKDAFKAACNAGQLKAAANSLNVKLFEPEAKPEEMSQDEKVNLYVREVLLMPVAYDILVKMSMAKS